MPSNTQERIGQLLKTQGKTLSSAESCTGGRISHLITTVPGASTYFLGGVTSYAIAVKEKVLGVPAVTIRDYGVVSSEVAAAMAEGVRKLTGSDYAVSTTGLAGPGGDGKNPEGTVWIAVTNGVKTLTFCRHFNCGRVGNIRKFTLAALKYLEKLIGESN